ncbi:MAG: hypothetical protein COB04_07700 [Gammaproteobacteria bacterium]|nr:MAG: hypothetical protein COB04_07700 [Gammaproteobacteria bacterium]
MLFSNVKRYDVVTISAVLFVSFVLSTISSISNASAPTCEDPFAEAVGVPDSSLDGYFLGANGCIYDPELFSSSDIPVIGVEYDVEGVRPVIIVNGALSPVDAAFLRLRSISTVKQRSVIGIYNAAGGIDNELRKLVDVNNKASQSIQREAMERILNKEVIEIQALSGGGIILARGLRQLVSELGVRFLFRRSFRKNLLSLIHVETGGTAGLYFPNGPRYVHYTNTRDIVVTKTGVLSPLAHPGRGAVIATFDYVNEDCVDGGALLDEYPGVNADLNPGGLSLSPSAHSVCVYAATGYPYAEMRKYAPRVGYAIVPLELKEFTP